MASVADWIAELNDHGFEDTGSTRKIAVLNDTIDDVCSREPWPFLEKEVDLTFDGTSGLSTSFPADFSKATSLVDPTTTQPIPWERLDVLRRRYPAGLSTVADPTCFYFRANKFFLFPVPPAGRVLNLEYLCWHPVVDGSTLESGILIPARHHRVVVLGSLAKLYAMEDDPEQGQLFDSLYEKRIASMREDLMREQYDRPDRIFVVDEDDYDI